MSDSIQRSYDRLAAEYTRRIYGELAEKPFDRKMLDWLVERVGTDGMICDMGCGPGQVARYLHDRGAAACGVDLSPEMIAQARIHSPMINFQQGDMFDLAGVTDGSYAAIAAFYSIVHVQPDQLPLVFAEFGRVLRKGGTLLLTFHVGDEIRHFDALWEIPVALDFIFFESEAITHLLSDAGFVITEVIERFPYAESIEAQTRRAYIFAQKPHEPS